MRIERIEIDAFGLLKSKAIGPFSKGLTVILGGNEAGKSTILSFIHTMFFGFPDRRRSHKSYEPPEPGSYGGHILLSSDGGDKLVVERKRRFDGTKSHRQSTRIYLTDDGNILSEAALQKYFGSITRQLYENVFGFSLDELQGFESLNASEIKDAIYGAGFGTALLAVPKTRKNLEKQLSGLFKPSGQKQEINKLLSRLEDLKSRLRNAKSQLDQYEMCKKEIKESEDALKTVEKDLKEVGLKLQRLRHMISSWEEYTELLHLKERIKEGESYLGTKVPEKEDLWKARAFMSEKEEASRLLEQKESELSRVRMQIDGIRFNKNVVQKAGEIKELLSKRHLFASIQQEIIRNKQQREDLQARIREGLLELGEGWSEERIKGLDTGASAKAEIKEFKRRFDKLDVEKALLLRERGLRQDDLKRLCTKKEQLSKEKKEVSKALGQFHENHLEEATTALQRAEAILEELLALKGDSELIAQSIEAEISELGMDSGLEGLSNLDYETFVRNGERLLEEYGKTSQSLHVLSSRLEQEEDDLSHLNHLLLEKKEKIEKIDSELDLEKEEIHELAALVESLSGAIPLRHQLKSTLNAYDSELHKFGRRLRELDSSITFWQRLEKVGIFLYLAGGSLILLYLSSWNGLHLPYDKYLCGLGVFFLMSAPITRVLARKKSELLFREKETVSKDAKNIDVQKKALVNELERIGTELSRVAELTALDKAEAASDFNRIIRKSQNSLRLLQKRQGLRDELHQTNTLLSQKKQVVDDLKAKIKQLEQSTLEIKNKWKDLLSKHTLPKGLELKEFPLFSKKLGNIMLHLAQFYRLEEKKAQRCSLLEDTIARLTPYLGDVEGEGAAAGVEEGLSEIKDRLKYLSKKIEEFHGFSSQIEQIDQEICQLDSAINEIDLKLEAINEKKADLEKKWRQLLKKTGVFDGGIKGIEGVLEIFQRAEEIKKLLLNKERLEKDISRLEIQIDGERRKIHTLIGDLDLGIKFESLVQVVDHLVSLYENEAGKAERHEQLKAKMALLDKEIETLRNKVTTAQKGLERLLSTFQVTSLQGLDELVQRVEQLCQERSRFNEILLMLSSRFAVEPNIEDVSALFSGNTIHQVEAEARELERRETELLSYRDELYRKRAEAAQLLEGLMDSTEHQNLLLEYETTRVKLKTLTVKWSVLSLAKTLLKGAREKFERENQPAVLSEASGHFSRITMGRYMRILPDAKAGFVAVSRDGRRVSPDKLSRGTAEQLYLCLRFGVISACEPKDERIPVLMDDIFVNFDPDRMRLAAKAVAELSKKRQVLFFTCHPHIASILESEGDAVKTLTI